MRRKKRGKIWNDIANVIVFTVAFCERLRYKRPVLQLTQTQYGQCIHIDAGSQLRLEKALIQLNLFRFYLLQEFFRI